VPVSYRVDRENGLLWQTWEGRVTLAEVVQFRDALKREGLEDWNSLVDLRNTTGSPIDTDQLRALARDPVHKSKVAILAKDHAHQFGRARMFELTATAQEQNRAQVRVFTSLDNALAWLTEAPAP
jgi:NADH dehydrogenase/NADH:ubiquinone oxidoreductase subunit G